jgi:predicted ATP-grasp superfamily ATP-dependent carboligase
VTTPPLREPWLVAAWPGMGAVGLLAANHLARLPWSVPAGEVPAEPWFDVPGIQVEGGLLRPIRRPRTMLFAARDPRPAGRDLVVLLAEAQPGARLWDYSRALLKTLKGQGIRRVVTFAALASVLEVGTPSRVHAAATGEGALEEALRAGALRLDGGEIGGLNGVLLGAAAAEGMEGIGLLGEFPYVATPFPNPRASAAVLRVFSALSSIEVDVRRLDDEAIAAEGRVREALAREAEERAEEARETAPETPVSAHAEPEEVAERGSGNGHLTADQRAHIEHLFLEAAKDRGAALALKAELDRLGAFRDYKDRFLDLFKRAE